ncbi:hypothetical protein [Deminuibacter soli]|uniref:Uncharacterized protein n=1 Tax=Deminuibacter soli TaxID=2291815 RepID=A0A3E1NF00_9BACT|nr:hypothetical protein [Deminuibacter soli]RFM26556.1 hypothetical protein DXN05_18435 [Deminuibacter soli]
MKTLLFVLLLLSNIKCGNTTTTVYVCDSTGAIRYHYKANCRGLSNCQHRIVQTTLESAQKSNKTLCKWEQSAR